ncbi:hypothetical protein [Streptomyces longwoodensis]|uniref:hypothetical protein n=1 Tax=Streptomyces longwoodensis TaxID=68231 RepID=UPI00225B5D3C|nr:hypothetical protein [Streptomyces longwoodensis]MCX4994629.1 hypothetical protein [Streptomyces longwoodensis]
MQWWQLAIPAASSLVGAWTGAVLQARNGLKQLREQNQEADRVRAEQAEENARIRSEERHHALKLRVIDEKRAAYATFLRVLDDVLEADAERKQCEGRWEPLDAMPIEERPTAEWRTALEDLQAAVQHSLALAERMIDAAYTIYFLSPGEINNLVRAWMDARDGGADRATLDRLAEEFRRATRKDLGIADPELPTLS